jgi:PAS domain S-box-containing protein
MLDIEPNDPPSLNAEAAFLFRGGELGSLMRAHDWSSSPLGRPDAWPQPLKTLVEVLLGADQPMFIAWGGDRTLLYNDGYAEILADRHPLALGRPFFSVWHELQDDLVPLFERVFSGEPVHMDDIELYLDRPGRPKEAHFAFSYNPVRDEAGTIAGLFCPCTETTKAVLAERRREALLMLDERLRDVSDTGELAFAASELLGHSLGACRVAYGEVDPISVTIEIERDWNAPGFGSVVGIHHFEDYGSHAEDLKLGNAVVNADVESDPRTAAKADALIALGVRAHLDVPVVEAGQTVAEMFVHSPSPRIWTEEEIAFVRDFAKRTRAAIARRIAEQESRANEVALRDSEARLREMNETLEQRILRRTAEIDRLWTLSEDMLARADYHGMMSAVSPAWTRVLGFSYSELLARPYADFMHPDDAETSIAALTRMSETKEPTRFANRILCVDGGYKTIEWIVAPEPDGLNFIAVGRDVSADRQRQSDLEQAQDALRQAQKMDAMGQLTGGVAHDFNNLLTPIVGSLDILQRKELGGEREQRLIAGAMEAAERARVLVQRLLAFARRQPLQPTSVDVAGLVTGMVSLLESTTGPQINIITNVSDAMSPALADANQVEMALLNLCVNARDAMPGGGTLRVSASEITIASEHPSGLKPGTYICVSVADTGTGMDETTIARAIEPFFSTKGIGKGTGLGLSMVHGLASQLGGALTIQSQLNVGTSIELWLPLSENSLPEPSLASDARPIEHSAGKALLVDDEYLVRLSTADMLSNLGFEVIEAGSADDALQIIRDGVRPDLLVTDHLMAGLSGTELARIVRAEYPDTQILIVSGYADADGVAPDLPRLSKPFREHELKACVAALTRSPQ